MRQTQAGTLQEEAFLLVQTDELEVLTINTHAVSHDSTLADRF